MKNEERRMKNDLDYHLTTYTVYTFCTDSCLNTSFFLGRKDRIGRKEESLGAVDIYYLKVGNLTKLFKTKLFNCGLTPLGKK